MSEWLECIKRIPTIHDTDHNERIMMTIHENNKWPIITHYTNFNYYVKQGYTHWLPLSSSKVLWEDDKIMSDACEVIDRTDINDIAAEFWIDELQLVLRQHNLHITRIKDE